MKQLCSGSVIAREWRLFCVALQFLTRVPVPSFPHFEVAWLSQSLRYFPVVGMFVALVQWFVWLGLGSFLPHAVALAWMMGAGLLLTGGFHEDGWADVCDGLGGAYDKERALTIMKDSRVGAFGAMGLVWMLLSKWATLGFIGQAGILLLALVAAHAFSRLWATDLIVRLDHVGDAAHSKTKPLGNQMSRPQWMVSAAIALAVCCFAALVLSQWTAGPLSGRPGAAVSLVLLMFGVAGVVSYLCGRWFQRRLGGYTGDCLGATQQLCELALYAAVLGVMRSAVPVSGAW